MELGSKVTALEEEIAVLKGEIKMILQEVRTAVLARDNPFAVDHFAPPSDAIAPAVQPTPEPERDAAADTGPQVLQFAAPKLPEEPVHQAATSQPRAAVEIETARPAVAGRRRWSIASLATLMGWMQDTASRMDANDLDIVLSLARYGGLIEEELEATLNKLAAPLLPQEPEKRRIGVSEYLLALRELAALLEEAEDGYRSAGSIRKAS